MSEHKYAYSIVKVSRKGKENLIDVKGSLQAARVRLKREEIALNLGPAIRRGSIVTNNTLEEEYQYEGKKVLRIRKWSL